MDFSVFLFAFFVFVLLCLLILLYSRQRRPKKNGTDDIAEKEKRLFKLYQNLEDMIGGAEDYIEEAKSSIEKDKEEVSAIKEKIREVYNAYKNGMQAKVEEEAAQKPDGNGGKAANEMKAPDNISKNELVRFLKDEGLNELKIARELGISKGEVSLILGIKKN